MDSILIFPPAYDKHLNKLTSLSSSLSELALSSSPQEFLNCQNRESSSNWKKVRAQIVISHIRTYENIKISYIILLSRYKVGQRHIWGPNT